MLTHVYTHNSNIHFQIILPNFNFHTVLFAFFSFYYRYTAVIDHFEPTDDNQLSFKKGDKIEFLDIGSLIFLQRRQIEIPIIDGMFCIYGRNCRTTKEGYLKPSSLLENPNGNKLKLYQNNNSKATKLQLCKTNCAFYFQIGTIFNNSLYAAKPKDKCANYVPY